tara:strand:+ start:89 stop:589 length:501 start_codon:yes stop_codon:yes gene_type:complete
MAEILLINTADLKKHSSLSGDTDDDKIKQFIKIAQDVHVEPYLGTDLFDRLKNGVDNDDLTVNENALINNYVKWMTIHFSLVEVLGHIGYSVSNNGVSKRINENSEGVDKSEVDSLIERHRQIALSYTRKFISYMCYNDNLFPEYDSNTNEDINPSKDANFHGWVL